MDSVRRFYDCHRILGVKHIDDDYNIGIPFGLQTIKLTRTALFPFGTKIIDNGSGNGCLNLIMNVIWWIVGGIPIALTHLGWGLLLCITIIGIPFGIQHFKLARLALLPFGKTVV